MSSTSLATISSFDNARPILVRRPLHDPETPFDLVRATAERTIGPRLRTGLTPCLDNLERAQMLEPDGCPKICVFQYLPQPGRDL
jgi:hypothetical protein